MVPKQALDILDRAAAMAPLSRENHVIVQRATQVLGASIAKAQDKTASPTDADEVTRAMPTG